MCVCVCEIIYTCTVHLYNYTCVCIYVFIYLSIQFYSYFRVAHVPCIPFATWHTPTLLGCAMHGGPVASAQYLAGLREFLHLSRALSTIGSLAITMTCYDCAQVPGIARCEGGRKRPPCGPVWSRRSCLRFWFDGVFRPSRHQKKEKEPFAKLQFRAWRCSKP